MLIFRDDGDRGFTNGISWILIWRRFFAARDHDTQMNTVLHAIPIEQAPDLLGKRTSIQTNFERNALGTPVEPFEVLIEKQ